MEKEFEKAFNRIDNEEKCLALLSKQHPSPKMEEYRQFILGNAVDKYLKTLTDNEVENLIEELK